MFKKELKANDECKQSIIRRMNEDNRYLRLKMKEDKKFIRANRFLCFALSIFVRQFELMPILRVHQLRNERVCLNWNYVFFTLSPPLPPSSSVRQMWTKQKVTLLSIVFSFNRYHWCSRNAIWMGKIIKLSSHANQMEIWFAPGNTHTRWACIDIVMSLSKYTFCLLDYNNGERYEYFGVSRSCAHSVSVGRS